MKFEIINKRSGIYLRQYHEIFEVTGNGGYKDFKVYGVTTAEPFIRWMGQKFPLTAEQFAALILKR